MRIGIDLGGTKIECAALDARGVLLFRRRVPTPRDDYGATLRAVDALVTEAERVTGRRGSVGIGTPGTISPATGRIKNANSVWLNDRPLAEDLERLLRRDVRFENDANCFALSEAIDGAAAGARVVFGVIIGTGTGGGAVIDGSVLRGANAIAGEWGHNPLPWPREHEIPGPVCWCGRRGCIETYLSGPGLSRDHGEGLDASTVAARAAKGDPLAAAAVDRYVDRLARSLASVIHVLDPEIIVLGGGLSNLERLTAEVPRLWGRWIFSDRVDTRLSRAAHGDSSGVRGAAWLWPPEAS